MKRNDRVRVKQTGRTGTVIADAAPGELVKVEFDDEAIDHEFSPDELELIGEDD